MQIIGPANIFMVLLHLSRKECDSRPKGKDQKHTARDVNILPNGL